MIHPLQHVRQDHTRSQAKAHRLYSIHHAADYVRRGLEDIRPNQVEQMQQSVLVTKTGDADSEMLDDSSSRLSMNMIAIRQGVFEKSNDRVNVVFGHLADVLKDECECFQTTVPNVQLRCPVLVEDGGYASERTTCFGNDG